MLAARMCVRVRCSVTTAVRRSRRDCRLPPTAATPEIISAMSGFVKIFPLTIRRIPKPLRKFSRAKNLSANFPKRSKRPKVRMPKTRKPAMNQPSEQTEHSTLQTAANLRRRAKTAGRKRVEIVWEEHDNAPNGWFIIVALILTVFAIAVWVLSTYLE